MPSPRVFRTPGAIADLDAIWDNISRDNLAASDRMLDELNERFVLLSKYPELGERQPLLADGTFRRFTHWNYVI